MAYIVRRNGNQARSAAKSRIGFGQKLLETLRRGRDAENQLDRLDHSFIADKEFLYDGAILSFLLPAAIHAPVGFVDNQVETVANVLFRVLNRFPNRV
mgnify:CR=1 FL=1